MMEDNKDSRELKEKYDLDPRELVARFADRKIEAIKYVREKTGFGLKEAKDLVDAAYERFSAAPPEADRRAYDTAPKEKKEVYEGPEIKDKPSRWPIVLTVLVILFLALWVAYRFVQ